MKSYGSKARPPRFGLWDAMLFLLLCAVAVIGTLSVYLTIAEGAEPSRVVRPRLEAEPLPIPAAEATEIVWNKYLAQRLHAETPRLWDGSFPDLVLARHAVEVDWADRKWREAPGQAALYAELLGKEPAVLLLVKDRDAERVEILRAFIACRRLGVELWLFDCKSAEFLPTRSPPGGSLIE